MLRLEVDRAKIGDNGLAVAGDTMETGPDVRTTGKT